MTDKDGSCAGVREACGILEGQKVREKELLKSLKNMIRRLEIFFDNDSGKHSTL